MSAQPATSTPGRRLLLAGLVGAAAGLPCGGMSTAPFPPMIVVCFPVWVVATGVGIAAAVRTDADKLRAASALVCATWIWPAAVLLTYTVGAALEDPHFDLWKLYAALAAPWVLVLVFAGLAWAIRTGQSRRPRQPPA
jgi:hypothetical protein